MDTFVITLPEAVGEVLVSSNGGRRFPVSASLLHPCCSLPAVSIVDGIGCEDHHLVSNNDQSYPELAAKKGWMDDGRFKLKRKRRSSIIVLCRAMMLLHQFYLMQNRLITIPIAFHR